MKRKKSATIDPAEFAKIRSVYLRKIAKLRAGKKLTGRDKASEKAAEKRLREIATRMRRGEF